MAGTSKGAAKGWASRRAEAQRRSEAARKGWATRRANERGLEYWEAPVFLEDDIFEIDY